MGKMKPLPPTQKLEEMQRHIAAAQAELDAAVLIADEIGEEIEFLGRTYIPRVTTTTVSGGTWDAPEDAWQSSSYGC